ncbi:flavodoxin [candidate division KSB3 bacterium]|uniref:Flavodoxin n=1 Tax=candidate division KSB3 bacterium TaxID=2044937 RepID=A0A2G6EAL8_9BACT|nr:MAG: flavodoxin [candidate division KSB3 bacterium]PIE30859.1 MAG: flavodoxin [candidate division KSB3 bacterium]
MKKIVIFYSFEGNTRLIANTIAKTVDADILELTPKDEIQSTGIMKYVWGGKAALMNAKPALLPYDKNIQEYDLLFIGTPVWAWTFAPPLNTFLATEVFVNKKIALFCCHGGGKGKIFRKMAKVLTQNQILGEADFKDPLKHHTEANLEKAKKWAERIMNTLSTS